MDFGQAIQQGSAPAAPPAPAGAPAPGGATPAAQSPMGKIEGLFPPEPGTSPAPASAASAPAPAAPAQAPAPAQTPDPSAQFQAQLKMENARLREELAKGQQTAAQTEAMAKAAAAMERMAQIQANPALTPEQQKAAIDAEFAELNGSSPKGTIKKWISPELEALKQQNDALVKRLDALEPSVQKIDRFAVRDTQLERLYASGHAEVADQNFRAGMMSAENVESTLKQFYSHVQDPSAAEKIYQDPGFYNALLMNQKLRAAAGFAPTIAQSQADMAQQGQIAQAGGGLAPNGRPAGSTNGAPALTPDQQFKQQLLGTRKSFGELINQAPFGQR